MILSGKHLQVTANRKAVSSSQAYNALPQQLFEGVDARGNLGNFLPQDEGLLAPATLVAAAPHINVVKEGPESPRGWVLERQDNTAAPDPEVAPKGGATWNAPPVPNAKGKALAKVAEDMMTAFDGPSAESVLSAPSSNLQVQHFRPPISNSISAEYVKKMTCLSSTRWWNSSRCCGKECYTLLEWKGRRLKENLM